MRGQTALELMLIAALVMALSTSIFMMYSGESFHTVAESTIRSQVDWYISQAAFDNPGCADTKLKSITPAIDGRARDYTIATTDPACTGQIFTQDTLDDIQGKVSLALECPYATNGHCRGYKYIVHAA